MKFRYRSIISLDFEQGTPFFLMRPEIPVTVIGSRGRATYSALVDTGADNVVFPRSVADELGIELHPSERCQATGFGGGTVSLLSGQATLEIGDAQERLRWTTRVLFNDCEPEQDEIVLLGYLGFLEFFQANFDGPKGWLELTPSARLPIVSASESPR